MALSLNEKLTRILLFLVNVRHPSVFGLLCTRGFSQTAFDEGWALFSVAAGAKHALATPRGDPLATDQAPKALASLDDWENEWFPVVSATLERNFPALHSFVFKNLSQTEGREVLVSVGTLLERLTAMRTLGEEGKSADALLSQRGLTGDKRAEAQKLIDLVKHAEEIVIPEIDPRRREEQEQTLALAWSWYREWSQIARVVIKRGDVLVRLGLRRLSRGGTEEEVPPDDTGTDGGSE